MSINSRSQQDSNLRGKIPSDFYSDAITTRPWLLADLQILLCLFWCFLSSICIPVDEDGQNNTQKSMLISICFLVVQDEPKNTQSARFELAREHPIWFLVRRLNHSAMTACGLSGSFESLLISVIYLFSCWLRWAKTIRRSPCWFLSVFL